MDGIAPEDQPGRGGHRHQRDQEEGDERHQAVRSAGIGTACHYPLPIPAQPLFAELGYDATAFPAAWAASREVLSLPCFPELRPDEIDAVIGAVRTFFEGAS